ncbi:MAG: MmcQ/YjbR family DNA-binding protein [Gemmatimonadaceae bacterium]|nr:MmcQ/YjbR family DNA-binding protein [Gemmatimonadaceae bacterium]
MASDPLARLRTICLALPDSAEVPAWDTFTYRRKGKIFAIYGMPDDVIHSGGRPSVSLKAAAGNQQLMVRDNPDRYFVPPYVGKAGWIGVRLDKRAPWKEIEQLVAESWELVLLKKTKDGGRRTKAGAKPPPQREQSAARKKPATKRKG